MKQPSLPFAMAGSALVDDYRRTLTPAGTCARCGRPVGYDPTMTPTGMRPLRLHLDSLMQTCPKKGQT